LILTESLPKSTSYEYVTLSYCWGVANNAARTTEDNLAERLDAILLRTLPKTLQDAI